MVTILMIVIIFFFVAVKPFAPPTLFPVRALYLDPCTRLYEIRIYRHCSSLRVLTAGLGLQDPQQLWGRFALYLFGVGPIPLDIVCTL